MNSKYICYAHRSPTAMLIYKRIMGRPSTIRTLLEVGFDRRREAIRLYIKRQESLLEEELHPFAKIGLSDIIADNLSAIEHWHYNIEEFAKGVTNS